jgi:hypothetical protein
VSSPLGCDAQSVCVRELDDLDDVAGGFDEHDRERPLVDREVPCSAGFVPTRIAGEYHLALEPRTKHADAVLDVRVRGERPAMDGALGSYAFGCDRHRLSLRLGYRVSMIGATPAADIGQVADPRG